MQYSNEIRSASEDLLCKGGVSVWSFNIKHRPQLMNL